MNVCAQIRTLADGFTASCRLPGRVVVGLLAPTVNGSAAMTAFVATARDGTGKLEKLGIRGAQAADLISAGESLFRRLEEVAVAHALEVRLDISWIVERCHTRTRDIDELSKGQRATALLLLRVGASTAPLVMPLVITFQRSATPS